MTKPLTYILTLFALLTTACNGQTTKEDKLLGNWELFESNQKIILYFQKGGTVDFDQNGQQFKADYKFTSDTTLLLGSTLYKVLTLSDKDLIIETTGFLPTKYHYQKTENTIKPIKEYETVSETYQNGQKKVEGKYHNGFKDGKWTEWYENGQLKSIQNFKDGIPIGKQEFWYENGQKKEEKEFDSRHQLLNLTRWDEDGNIKEQIKN
ncbi:MAG: hypothetical protein R2772_06695 [Chitinophagales bacterium]